LTFQAPLSLLRILQNFPLLVLRESHETQDVLVGEIGSGSGYQAAMVAKLARQVYTTEVIPELVTFARENLKKASITNVEVFEMDGTRGLPDKGPFDKIIITAACKEFPPKLIDQLKEGGMIVGPVGNKNEQEMVRGIKEKDRLALEFYGQFLFTPMYGEYGFEV